MAQRNLQGARHAAYERFRLYDGPGIHPGEKLVAAPRGYPGSASRRLEKESVGIRTEPPQGLQIADIGRLIVIPDRDDPHVETVRFLRNQCVVIDCVVELAVGYDDKHFAQRILLPQFTHRFERKPVEFGRIVSGTNSGESGGDRLSVRCEILKHIELGIERGHRHALLRRDVGEKLCEILCRAADGCGALRIASIHQQQIGGIVFFFHEGAERCRPDVCRIVPLGDLDPCHGNAVDVAHIAADRRPGAGAIAETGNRSLGRAAQKTDVLNCRRDIVANRSCRNE